MHTVFCDTSGLLSDASEVCFESVHLDTKIERADPDDPHARKSADLVRCAHDNVFIAFRPQVSHEDYIL